MNFSEAKFHENYLTLDFHTNTVIQNVFANMASKTVLNKVYAPAKLRGIINIKWILGRRANSNTFWTSSLDFGRFQNLKRNEYVTIAVNCNLSNCEKARKKGFRGFNGIRTRGLCVSAAVLYQPELWRPIHWRPANLLSSSTREKNETQNEMMWTAGIQMKWVCDHRWSIAQAGRALQR